MKSLKVILASILLVCTGTLGVYAGGTQESTGKAELKFAFWGSPLEKEVITKVSNEFEKTHPGITVKPLFTPVNYDERLSAMVAGGIPPDVAYCHEGQAFNWAYDGVIMNLKPFIDKDLKGGLKSRIGVSWYWYDHGTKILGSSIAGEIMVLYYNKEIFKEHDVPYPPADPDKAWNWDQFLAAAEKLTTVGNGGETYGVTFGTWPGPLLPFIRSNGGDFINDAGTAPVAASPQTVDVLQKLADLINVYHVAPSPTALESTRSLSIEMASKHVAMAIDGQWELLDLAKAGFPLGIAPIPVFKNPVALWTSAPLVLFSATKHPKDAWDFSKYLQDAQNVLPVLKSGLWMPLQTSWYTDPNLLDKWVDPTTHPSGYKEAVVDYLLKYPSQYPSMYLRNWDEIQRIIIQDLSNLWLGKETAESAARKIDADLKPLLKGRTDR